MANWSTNVPRERANALRDEARRYREQAHGSGYAFAYDREADLAEARRLAELADRIEATR